MIAAVLANELRGVIRQRIGVIVFFFWLILGVVGDGEVGVAAHERTRVPETAGALNGAVVTVEAALQGPIRFILPVRQRVTRGDVPFASGVGAIARGLEGFGDGDAATVQRAAIAVDAVVVHHVADAGLVRIKPGEQRGACGAATAHVVKLREAHAASR